MKKFDLTKAVTEKVTENSSEKVQRATKPIEKRPTPALMTSLEETEKFTGLFDLSTDGLYIVGIGAGKKAKRSKGGGSYCMQSIYFQPDEKEHLDELAEKYGCSASAIIRTLIANAK